MAVNVDLYLRPGAADVDAPFARSSAASTTTLSDFKRRVSEPVDGVPFSVTEVSSEATAATEAYSEAAGATETYREAAAGGATAALSLVAPRTSTQVWQGLLPELEAELGSDLRAFRKRMLAGKVPADYVNDMFPGRRSGAWAIYRDIRCVDGQPDAEFCLYVRRNKDQLAVWEGTGTPDSLRANFSVAYPGPPLTADAVRRGFAAALVRHRLISRR